MKSISGIITALVTPFLNGEVDTASLKKLVRYQMDQGVDGLVVHGTTAESPTTTPTEKEKIFKLIKAEVANQIPLIVGTGTNSTSDSVEKTRQAKKWGADAALSVVPYYNKPPQRGLIRHFEAIAKEADLPVILYNVPGRTVAALELESIIALSKHPNIIGIKEATGDVSFGKQIIEKCAKDFFVLSGDDKTFVELKNHGAKGIIGVVTHLIADKIKNIDAKDYEKYFQLIDSLYLEANPIPIKYALKKLGIIASEEMRLPLSALKDDLRNKIDRALEIL